MLWDITACAWIMCWMLLSDWTNSNHWQAILVLIEVQEMRVDMADVPA